MNSHLTLWSIATCVLVFAHSATSQSRRGVLFPASSGLVFDGVQFAPTTHFTKGGIQASVIEYQSTSSVPDYSHAALFSQHQSIARYIKIDGMSTGNDLMPVTSRGRVTPTGLWAMLAFSVTKGSSGESNSWIRKRATASTGEGPGAEIMGYYFPGSRLPARMPGQLFIEHSAIDIVGHPFGERLEVRALDTHMPWIAENSGMPILGLFSDVTHFYFTVTSDSARDLRFRSFFPEEAVVSGATILKMTLGQNGSWTGPELVANPDRLGLLATDEVDALGIRDDGATIFFSVDYDPSRPTRSQLQVRVSGAVHPLTDQSGNPIRPGVRILPQDDIDGICGTDPEYLVFNSALGSPVELTPNIWDLAVATTVAEVPRKLVVTVSGWTASAPPIGPVVVYLVMPNGDRIPWQTALVPVGALAVEFQVPIPTSLIGSGMLLALVATAGSSSGLLEDSFYSGITL